MKKEGNAEQVMTALVDDSFEMVGKKGKEAILRGVRKAVGVKDDVKTSVAIKLVIVRSGSRYALAVGARVKQYDCEDLEPISKTVDANQGLIPFPPAEGASSPADARAGDEGGGGAQDGPAGDPVGEPGPSGQPGVSDEELRNAFVIIRDTKRASVSGLQRRMKVSFTKAAAIMDVLEDRGVVGPANGNAPRDILDMKVAI